MFYGAFRHLEEAKGLDWGERDLWDFEDWVRASEEQSEGSMAG